MSLKFKTHIRDMLRMHANKLVLSVLGVRSLRKAAIIQLAGRRIRLGDDTDDSFAPFVAKGYSNAKMRELSKVLAAIRQPVNLRAIVTNFHLCSLKWQNLSAVAPTPQLCRSSFLPSLPRIFHRKHVSLRDFSACARKVSMGGIT